MQTGFSQRLGPDFGLAPQLKSRADANHQPIGNGGQVFGYCLRIVGSANRAEEFRDHSGPVCPRLLAAAAINVL